MNLQKWQVTSKILILQAIVYLLILLDIPVLRQVTVFAYLIFVPGFILMRTLRLHLPIEERIPLYAGLSITFLMILGLLLNASTALGISEPLSSNPVIFCLNLAVLVFSICSDVVNTEPLSLKIDLDKKQIGIILLALLIPAISIAGAILTYNTGSNILSLTTTLLIAAVFLFLIVFDKRIQKYHALFLFVFSLALLLQFSLVSPYIYGFDVNEEYFVFRITQINKVWNPSIGNVDLRVATYNSMLSVTILPTIFQQLLNIDPEWVFKSVYMIIYSLVPIVLYQFYSKNMDKRTSFIAVFFFMSFSEFFFGMPALARETIGELFFVLLLLISMSLTSEVKNSKKTSLFIILGFALVVSHYSVSYFFLFFLIIAWLVPKIMLKNRPQLTTPSQISLFFTIAFSWSVYVSSSASFNALLRAFNNVRYSLFTEFFNPQARESLIWAGLGAGAAPSFGHQVGRFIYLATEFFIVIGVLGLIVQRKKSNFKADYISMSIAAMLILIACIVFPNFSEALRVERIFHLMLIFLAPFIAIGVATTFDLARKMVNTLFTSHNRKLGKIFSRIGNFDFQITFLLILLISYFLVSTGFVYEVTNDVPSSIALSGYRIDRITFYEYIITEREVAGAQWLNNFSNPRLLVYADYFSKDHVLASYGLFPSNFVDTLYRIKLASSNTTFYYALIQNNNGSYIYFRELNINNRVFMGWYEVWKMDEMMPYFETGDTIHCNKIYSNGGCDIFKIITGENITTR